MSRRHDADPEAVRDELAAYALGALEPEEERALERHLEGCESCRSRLRWLSPAIDVLPASVEQLEPPRRLKRSLMTIVAAEAADAEREARAADRPRSRRSFAASLLRPAAALATLTLIALGVAIGLLASGDEDGGGPSASSTVIEARAIGAPRGVDAELQLFRDGPAMLTASQLPPLADDEVFQLWIERGDRVLPGSTFVADRHGSAEQAIAQDLGGARGIAVTREPRGGSESPTTPPFMEVPLRGS